jgi:hypothetical protein
MRRTVAFALIAGVAALVAGCGPTMLKSRGRLVKGGEPFKPGEGEIVRIAFVPAPNGAEPIKDYYVAEFNKTDGSFQVAGKDGRGMPPGKYRITVTHEVKRHDVLNGAFDEDNTPFVQEMTTSTPELVLDLTNPPAEAPPP